MTHPGGPIRLVDISPPVPVLHLEASELDSLGPIAAPFHVCLWNEGRPLAGWSEYHPQGQTLDPAVVRRTAAVVRRTAAVAPSRLSATPPNRSVGVIICTRDRPADLDRCLASFSDQSLRPNEIIVVDNASRDDATQCIVKKHNASYVREENPGLCYARNRGLAAAKSEIVAFTDDDTRLHRDWLRNLTSAFDDDSIWAATGLILPAELNTISQCVFEKIWGFGRGFKRRDFDPAYYAQTRGRGCPVWEIGAGASMAFRSCIFEKIGPFDVRLDAGASGCSGDSELWYRILHAGGVCRYEPNSVLFHYHRHTEAELRKQIRAYMRGHVSALLVQYRRTGDRGNLRRAFRTLPRWYLKQLWARATRPLSSSTCLVGEEIRGCLEGIAYYWKVRNAPAWLDADESSSISR